jgi:ubiquinone/menaquinone biosynthesis C-methylase UbiE
MVLLAFDSMNMLSGDKEILGIGVAKEEMIPIISNYCRRLFATDMYLDSGPWDEWSNLDMLKNPRLQFGDRLNFKKVVFQHVDGRDLPYEDNSFDAIFSCSSIEHFGNESDIRKSIQEIHRVLKPNGVAALSTEYKISGVDQLDNLQLFDKNRLFKIFIEGVNWKSLDFLDEIYCMTNPIDFRKSILDKKYFNETYPQIIFKFKNNVWTSVHLTLIKD